MTCMAKKHFKPSTLPPPGIDRPHMPFPYGTEGIVQKLKNSVKAIGLPFRYGTGEELDVLIGGTPMPACMCYRIDETETTYRNTMRCEIFTPTLYFIDRTSHRANSVEQERIVQHTKAYADAWLNYIRHSPNPDHAFELLSDPTLNRVYLEFEDIFTGIGVRVRLIESLGVCVEDPAFYFRRPPHVVAPGWSGEHPFHSAPHPHRKRKHSKPQEGEKR